MEKIKKRLLVILIFILVMITAFSVYWQLSVYKAVGQYSSVDVNITLGDGYIEVAPLYHTDKGVVFYPGGNVEPAAYTPLAIELAKAGCLVIIPEMPLNLAILGSNKADEIISSYGEEIKFVIGGHSLGGVAASQYAVKNPVHGLFLLASYPMDSIVDSGLNVVSIYGNQDYVASPDTLAESVELLPSDASIIVIDGGNHSMFGDYGFQKGDGVGTVTQEEQFLITVHGILSLF